MKFLSLMTVLTLSFSSNAAVPNLKCELFKNESLVRMMTKETIPNGLIVIDLGPLEEFTFGGFAQRGVPGTIVVGPFKSVTTETATDSVVSRSGNLLTVTCQILEE